MGDTASAGWHITVCDPIWHIGSCSGAGVSSINRDTAVTTTTVCGWGKGGNVTSVSV